MIVLRGVERGECPGAEAGNAALILHAIQVFLFRINLPKLPINF